MTLREFLTSEAKIGDIIVIREHGYQIGLTRIDNEGLFIHSLNPVILDLYKVVNYTHEERDWATGVVMVVDIKLDQGGGGSC